METTIESTEAESRFRALAIRDSRLDRRTNVRYELVRFTGAGQEGKYAVFQEFDGVDNCAKRFATYEPVTVETYRKGKRVA